MPRAIAKIGREKTLSTLAKNLFVIEETNKAADLRRAENALLRANPRLATRKGFQSGTSVIVPADIGLATKPRVDQPTVGLEGLMQEALQRLQLSERIVRDGFAKSNDDAKTALERLEEPSFRKKIKKAAPQANKLVPGVIKSLNQRIDENTRREVELTNAISDATSEIERLRDLVPKDDEARRKRAQPQ